MLDFLPAGKNFISVTTRGFPGCENTSVEYEFTIYCRKTPFELSIPVAQHGPDNFEPFFEEQEKWLNELADPGIERMWYCHWQINDEVALRRFLRVLEPFRIETKYF